MSSILSGSRFKRNSYYWTLFKLCDFVKEIENIFSVFLRSYRNSLGGLCFHFQRNIAYSLLNLTYNIVWQHAVSFISTDSLITTISLKLWRTPNRILGDSFYIGKFIFSYYFFAMLNMTQRKSWAILVWAHSKEGYCFAWMHACKIKTDKDYCFKQFISNTFKAWESSACRYLKYSSGVLDVICKQRV